MTGPVIETPRGKIILDKNGKAELRFSTDFQPKWQGKTTAAQEFIDSEVLRLSEPFTPLLTGTLIKTGVLGTKPGSGVVRWIAPYAKKQYYMKRKPGTETGPLRGPHWFERMKEVHGKRIIDGAKRIMGKK